MLKTFAAIGVFLCAAASSAASEALADLRARAESLLDAGPYAPVHKTETPPSGDKRDYFSLSPFHWPNPETEDGLPYVFRDGEVNPAARSEAYDRTRFGEMVSVSEDLALAYAHLGEARFAERAALLLRTWFLDEATAMTPHFEYAQFVPGARWQRPWGIIRGRQFPRVLRASQRLLPSDAWSEAEHAALLGWMRQYLAWLTASEKGRLESRAINNHGTYYDVQVAHLALAAGRHELAEAVLHAVPEKRIARQIAPDGEQRTETGRTRAWNYSVMNLAGLFDLAALGEQVGIELWRFETDAGAGIRQALDYLIPFALGEAEWPHEDLGRVEPDELYPLLMDAAKAYGSKEYATIAGQLPGSEDEAREYWLEHNVPE